MNNTTTKEFLSRADIAKDVGSMTFFEQIPQDTKAEVLAVMAVDSEFAYSKNLQSIYNSKRKDALNKRNNDIKLTKKTDNQESISE